MLVLDQKNDCLFFHVSFLDYEAIVLAGDSVDAATTYVEYLYAKFKKNLLLTSIVKTVKVSELLYYSDIDDCEEFHYMPDILSNAGLHDLAKKLKTIIDFQE